MKIVILGAGRVGSYLASVLSQEEHDIVLIDRSASVLEKVGREVDVATQLSSEISWRLFASLQEINPDVLIAATGDDETNLVACALAKNIGFPKTICLIKSRDYLECSRLDLARLFYVDHFIGAELLSAQDLFKLLIHAGDIAFEHFAHGAILMRTIQIPDHWDKGGTPIHSLHLPSGLIAGLIRRKTPEGTKVLIPHGNDHILPGDEATLVGEANIMNTLHHIFKIPEVKLKSVVLIGGSSIALHLAHFLIQQHVSLRIIEQNGDRCRELSERLPKATIIHRDGRDPDLFIEEQIDQVDALVSCTHDDGTNLLVASMAKQQGCPKTIALISDSAYIPIVEQAGVIPSLSARVNVANRIHSILHEETILSVASLSNDAAKIVELKVSPSSKFVGIPLSELSPHLPNDLLIAVIENRGRITIGQGHSVLCPDDRVISICNPHRLEQLQHFFSS
jgi:trk system potassium uptake protein TrkA